MGYGAASFNTPRLVHAATAGVRSATSVECGDDRRGLAILTRVFARDFQSYRDEQPTLTTPSR